MIPQWTAKVVSVPITVTLSAYATGDVVGGLLSCDVPQIKGGGYIAWVRLVDATGQAEPYTLYAFTSAPATIANDAAFAPTSADWAKLLTTLTIAAGNYDTTGADSVALVAGKDALAEDWMMFPTLANGKMYFYLVSGDTPDYDAATDLSLSVCFMVM